MREAEVVTMHTTTAIILLITVFLLGYLIVALLYPEKF
jgi:K+-transporting ATPase KdpF subunit